MDTPQEKRSSPRVAMHQVVRFERTATDSTPWQEGRDRGIGQDISSEGLSLLTDGPLHRGEVLRLHVPIEPDQASVPVFSEVRWARQTDSGFRVGLRFLA